MAATVLAHKSTCAGAMLISIGRVVCGALAGSLLSLWMPAPAGADEVAQLWAALRQGEAVAVMRHAVAPGTGDPASFRLDDCSTQRNLSEEGRAQARAIGERFRAHGIERAKVYSSQWCRCLETARLLDLGPVETVAALNSFFQNRQQGPAQTAEVLELLAASPSEDPIVLVTHQVNVTALTEVFPQSGEVVVARPNEGGGLDVLGRIPPPGERPPARRN